MRRLISLLFSLAALPGCALLAQSLTGTWQGTLQVGKELRIVVKISTTDADTLKAVLYSIDQGSQGIPAGNISRQGSTVKFAVPGIGGTYEGKLNPDGTSIAGMWTQGPKPVPLNLEHVTGDAVWTIPEAVQPKPMAADAVATFEVATIKPSDPNRPGKGFRVQNRNFSTINTSVSDLITFAYGMHPRQLVGAPAWVESEKYDIAAKPEAEGQPNDKQWKAMLQNLLADRFRLKFHREKKELSVYEVVPGKTGPKLTKSEADPNGLPGIGFRALGALLARNANMADFANLLQGTVVDRPVIDHTGLTGRFDFTLNWTPDQFQFVGLGVKAPPADSAADALPDLFTAMQQQLGLKLQATKAETEVLAIDRVEKPTAN